MTPEEKPIAYTDRSAGENGCWIWQKWRDKKGYGRMRVDRDRTAQTHRVAWELANGPIPAGLCVCHNCPGGDNPSCVNPAHLWLGTNADNQRDKAAKGTGKGNVSGTKNPKAKLTEDSVREIRIAAMQGATDASLALRFGVTRKHVSRVVNGHLWRELPVMKRTEVAR